MNSKTRLAILVLFAATALACSPLADADYDNLSNNGIPRPDLQFEYTSPKGVTVYSTVEVPAHILPVIDAGIQQTINRHIKAYPTWIKARSLSEWRVILVEPMATNQDGSPAIRVRGEQSAGTVIGVNYKEAAERENQYLVIPHQAGTQWVHSQYLLNSVAYEGEHRFEFPNNYEIFVRWRDSGDPHPRPFHLCGTDPDRYPC